ncbi:hypothetical protein GGR51DRAFT_255939 [Nemania sp. FL0031]|nr:hypothetical protein GGR51DRAFT_255939 [Nemania sp. FL0031]
MQRAGRVSARLRLFSLFELYIHATRLELTAYLPTISRTAALTTHTLTLGTPSSSKNMEQGSPCSSARHTYSVINSVPAPHPRRLTIPWSLRSLSISNIQLDTSRHHCKQDASAKVVTM